MEEFTAEEIEMISQAVYNHGDKDRTDGEFDELLKDADVLQHCLCNPMKEVAPHEVKRFTDLKKELFV